jgi:dienelactone hydrolase
MKLGSLIGILLVLSGADDDQGRRETFPIRPGFPTADESPTRKETEFREPRTGELYVRNVATPTLTAFLPDPAKANGTAVIVVPGGGFSFLRWADAVQDAQWLASRGIAAFVLKHRLIDTGATEEDLKKAMDRHVRMMMVVADAANAGKPLPALDGDLVEMIGRGVEDGRQAIRMLRRDVKRWGIKADRIGVLGLSSGGLVAMGAAIEHDAESRPDFIAPIYTPWFSGAEKAPHGAIPAFIGAKVPADAPPVFVAVASDDFIAVPGSLLIYNSWRAARRSAELHAYAEGGHGFGTKPQGLPVDGWLEQFNEWLTRQVAERR